MKRSGYRILSIVLIFSMMLSVVTVNAVNNNQALTAKEITDVEELEPTQPDTDSQSVNVEEKQEVNVKSVSEESGIYESYLRWEITLADTIIKKQEVNVDNKLDDEKTGSPKTFDSNMYIIWIALLLISISVFVSIKIYNKKKKF